MVIDKAIFQLILFFLYKSNELEALKAMQKVYLKYFEKEDSEFVLEFKH